MANLVKTPFDTEAGIAHESFAGEVITEFDLRADIEVRALEPPSEVVPELRFGDQHRRLPICQPLSPHIEETGEAETGGSTEVIAAPDEGELKGDDVPLLLMPDALFVLAAPDIEVVNDVFEEQFEIEDVLVIGRV